MIDEPVQLLRALLDADTALVGERAAPGCVGAASPAGRRCCISGRCASTCSGRADRHRAARRQSTSTVHVVGDLRGAGGGGSGAGRRDVPAARDGSSTVVFNGSLSTAASTRHVARLHGREPTPRGGAAATTTSIATADDATRPEDARLAAKHAPPTAQFSASAFQRLVLESSESTPPSSRRRPTRGSTPKRRRPHERRERERMRRRWSRTPPCGDRPGHPLVRREGDDDDHRHRQEREPRRRRWRLRARRDAQPAVSGDDLTRARSGALQLAE